MVKGVSRQVIVVKSPDPRLFEQAIFIVRDAPSVSGVTAEQVLEEARRVANGYVRQKAGWSRWFHRVLPAFFFAAGAAAASLAWLLGTLLLGA
ncbi:MAG: translation initiation factor 2 [Oscillospiraceae bacterium]